MSQPAVFSSFFFPLGSHPQSFSDQGVVGVSIGLVGVSMKPTS